MSRRLDSNPHYRLERSTPTARDAPLRMHADEFRRVGHALVDAIAEGLAAIPAGPVTRGEAPLDIQAALNASSTLPDEGTDAGTLLVEAGKLLFGHSLSNGHPRFVVYITAAPAPIGILGDLLASAVTPNVGSWRLSPMASEIEARAVRWVAELIGYPAGCGGLFVSGGYMANMVGLFAARAAAADWDVRAQGVAAAGDRRLRVYASAETHTWLQKATDLAGIGTDSIRWIPTDDELRLNVRELRSAMAQDRAAVDREMLVVVTAGSVS